MHRLRRILTLLGLVGLATALIRLRGRGGTPPDGSGWREIDLGESTWPPGGDGAPDGAAPEATADDRS